MQRDPAAASPGPPWRPDSRYAAVPERSPGPETFYKTDGIVTPYPESIPLVKISTNISDS